jgi:tRNA (cmo5U34)-methyltransferase
LAQRVLQAFPNAQVTCLDLADNMVTMDQTKLARYPNVRWLVGDFETFDGGGKYDAIVSSLALHHLVTDDDKRRFYRRIYDAPDSGGVFYNTDVVLASNDFLQAVYMREWRAFMRGAVSEAEIEGKWIPKYHAEDRPAKLVEQLSWLTEVGFVDVDVLWKHFNFAVYGGVKR